MQSSSTSIIERMKRRVDRERAARQQAENLLEDKSRELYLLNAELGRLNEDLAGALEQAKEVSEINRRLALSDSLTGLPNRRRLFEWLEAARRALDAPGPCCVGLLHVDLDRFKNVNDTLGHEVGDLVLVAAAVAMRRESRNIPTWRGASRGVGIDPIVARLGGDEFVLAGVVSKGVVEATADFTELANALSHALAKFQLPDGRDLTMGASIGVAVRPKDDPFCEPSALLAESDQALYRSKQRGRARATVYDDALRKEAEAKRQLLDALPKAIAGGELRPFYQAQVDAQTHRIVGAEALVRWMRKDGRIVAPNAFLTGARELGLVQEIDEQICRMAVDDLRRWRKNGLSLPKLSVNVSAGRLADPGLLGNLAPVGEREGLSFELLETMLLDDIDPATQMQLDAISEAGISIEIDDFGSGHASIVGLMRIRPSRIKLDRALVSPLGPRDHHRDVLRSIVEMAGSMGISVTAEGVETREQARLLGEIGVDTLQGFYFARPVCGAHFETLLREGVRGAA